MSLNSDGSIFLFLTVFLYFCFFSEGGVFMLPSATMLRSMYAFISSGVYGIGCPEVSYVLCLEYCLFFLMLIWSRRPLHCLWMPFSWNIFFYPFNLRLSLFANKKHFLQATNSWILFLNSVYKSVYFDRRLDWLTFRILICKIYYFLVYYCLCFLMFIFWHTSVACLLFMCSHEHFLFSFDVWGI